MYQLSVRVEGRLPDAPDFDNIILKAGADGSLVRLKDVGHAELGAETYRAELRFQAQDAVGFGVIQLPSANALDVVTQRAAELERLEKNFPPGLKYQIALDTTEVVSDSIREVLKTLVEAIILVVIVIFVFLQTWRSTIIPTITIPVSLIGAFAFIKLMGYSINTLTLFGIILATGIVVDDAIVVIENIERHIQEFKVSAKQGRGRRHGRSARRGHRHGAGAHRRVRADRVLSRDHRPPLRAVRDDDRVRRGALRVQRGDADAGARRRCCSTASTTARTGSGTCSSAGSPRARTATSAFLKRGMRSRWALVVVFFAALGPHLLGHDQGAAAFVPEEDQGYFISQVQAPAGSSLQYTGASRGGRRRSSWQDPDILAVFSVMGFSFSGAAPEPGHHVRPPEAVRPAQG